MLNRLFAAVVTSALVISGTVRAERHFQSGAERVSLLELYTSEGCSSCPPAETWLSELRENEGLWRTFVPVAFHVSYWDNLGWKDPFASKELTKRQYAWSEAWQASNVYTPCFVLDGKEWRPSGDRFAAPNDHRRPGVVEVTWLDDQKCHVKFVPFAKVSGPFSATVGLLGGNISSSVRAGENAGRTLRHDFVAVQLVSKKLEASTGGGGWEVEIAFTKTLPAQAKSRAFAAWVVAGEQPEPLQCVGGWLDTK